MRAVVVYEGGKVETRDDASTVEPGPDDVRVRLRAAGICRTDLSVVRGIFPSPMPCVLGHEGAGEIVEVGEAVAGLQVGDHVILTREVGCDTCAHCLRNEPHLCGFRISFPPRFRVGGDSAYGMVSLGTWADECVVPARSVVRFDPEVPYEIASLVSCGVMTGLGAAINTVRLDPGASVAVIGCGGVGASAIQGARLAGAGLIVAVDPAEDKHLQLEKFGATHVTTPKGAEEVTRELTGGAGFDVVFEALGFADTIRLAWEMTRRGGTAVIMGIGHTSCTVPFNAYELAMDAKTLIGSIHGSGRPRRDFPRILELWRHGRIDLQGLISERIPFDRLEAAVTAEESLPGFRHVITFD